MTPVFINSWERALLGPGIKIAFLEWKIIKEWWLKQGVMRGAYIQYVESDFYSASVQQILYLIYVFYFVLIGLRKKKLCWKNIIVDIANQCF